MSASLADYFRSELTHSPGSREVMRAFYRRLFPYKAVYRWLNQGDGELWCWS